MTTPIQPDQTLTQDEYAALMAFLAHAKPRSNRQKDLIEIANRYTDTALATMLSAASKITQAIQAEQNKSVPKD